LSDRISCGTAWGINSFDEASHASFTVLVFCSLCLLAEIAVFLSYLPAMPAITDPSPSPIVAHTARLPDRLEADRSDLIAFFGPRDGDIGAKSIQNTLPETGPEF
jgi:hypothetical protein